jgi:hypothetical protein
MKEDSLCTQEMPHPRARSQEDVMKLRLRLERTLIVIGSAALLALFTASNASAGMFEELDISVGLKASTVGVGGEVAWKINHYFVVRGGANWIGFGTDRKIDQIDYDFDLEFLNGSAFVDVHPFQNGFRITGGAFIGTNKVDLKATPDEPIEIGDITFTPAEIGTLKGKVDLNTFAPYAGFGWVSGHKKRSGFQFYVDLGVKFGGDPNVKLTSVDGLLSSDPTLLNEIDEEIKKIEDDLELLGFYPVIQLGFTYRF